MEASPAPERILVIALHYPPADGAAAIRARNLVRNLQALGHKVRVITPRRPIAGDVPPEAQTVRWLDLEHLGRRAARRPPGSPQTMSPPASWQRRLRTIAARLAFPDLHAPWIPGAIAAARREIADADLVLSTGGASAHVVARVVRGARPGIVDINDLWWAKALRQTGPIRDRVDRRLERWLVRSASALIVPAREQGVEVQRRWGRSSTTVPTGFDAADFTFGANGSHPAGGEIIFAGNLYTFPLDVVFGVLGRGRAELGWTPEQLHLSFIGSCAAPALVAAETQGVTEFVVGTPRIPRRELLQRLGNADALLLPLFAEDPHHLPMRFFEFVGAGRPIIGFGSPTVPAARLMQQHDLGPVCETTDELLAALAQVASGTRQSSPSPSTRALFELKHGRAALRELIEQTTPGYRGDS